MNYSNEREFQGRAKFSSRERNKRVVNDKDRRYETTIMKQQETFEPTVIGKGAYITGTLEVAGDLVMQGDMQGDISCQSKITATGTVQGNIMSVDIELDNALINGDVACSGDMELNETATINGNCEAINLVCGGKIQGDINMMESATFLEKSALSGNLSAQDIEIHKGAVIQGNVTVRQDVYFETDN